MSSSTTALRCWIALGVIAVLFLVSFPFIVGRRFVAEAERSEACKRGDRLDCEPSLLWNLYGLSVSDRANENETDEVVRELGGFTQPIRSSETAPQIVSVRPEGMSYEGGVYRAAVDDVVQLSIGTDGAKSVAADLVHLPFGGKPPERTALSITNRELDAFEAEFTIQKDLQGFIEITATGVDGATSTMRLPVASR